MKCAQKQWGESDLQKAEFVFAGEWPKGRIVFEEEEREKFKKDFGPWIGAYHDLFPGCLRRRILGLFISRG